MTVSSIIYVTVEPGGKTRLSVIVPVPAGVFPDASKVIAELKFLVVPAGVGGIGSVKVVVPVVPPVFVTTIVEVMISPTNLVVAPDVTLDIVMLAGDGIVVPGIVTV